MQVDAAHVAEVVPLAAVVPDNAIMDTSQTDLASIRAIFVGSEISVAGL